MTRKVFNLIPMKDERIPPGDVVWEGRILLSGKLPLVISETANIGMLRVRLGMVEVASQIANF